MHNRIILFKNNKASNDKKITAIEECEKLLQAIKDYIEKFYTQEVQDGATTLTLDNTKYEQNKKETKKIDRWNKILKEASEQSHRITIPKINNIISLKELINYKKDVNLICSLNEHTKPLDSYLTEHVKKVLFVTTKTVNVASNLRCDIYGNLS